MLKKLNELKKKNEGFTIVEVMIVLAIAGLIILIVFLAIPALQRNSRNTQRRDDASKLGASLQETANNNNGNFPTADCTGATTGGTPPVATCLVIRNASMGIFDETSANSQYFYNATAAGATATERAPINTQAAINEIKIVTFARCGATADAAATTTGATIRSAVIIYPVETSADAPTSQCVEL